MPSVTVNPLGVTIEVADGESLLAAALRQGLQWPSVCGGDAECGTCWVVVESGEDCSEVGQRERTRLNLGRKANDARARLACQPRVTGSVTRRASIGTVRVVVSLAGAGDVRGLTGRLDQNDPLWGQMS